MIWKGKGRWISTFIKPFSLVKVPISRDGPLAAEFLSGKKKLQPLIFSHGLSSHKMNYSGICREIASYGFLVIALNHNDRSCEFTTGPEVDVVTDGDKKDKVRQRIKFDMSFEFVDYEIRHPQVIIRENEVMALIDQVSTPAFIKDTFNGWEKAQLDLTKIVVGGHSFGGITALGTTCADRRVKACIGLDPWFFPHYKELNAGKFAVKSAD